MYINEENNDINNKKYYWKSDEIVLDYRLCLSNYCNKIVTIVNIMENKTKHVPELKSSLVAFTRTQQ